MALLGGGIALALAWAFISRGSLNNAFLPVFLLRGRDVFIGVVLCCLLGSLAGALPAASAMRLRVTDALRRN
jgi:ABC-type lipoprotein release transport system permease subunit